MENLRSPAKYFPPASGVYQVAPGLRPFPTDFGNDVQDRLVFQIDREWSKYRANKLACREERFTKYFVQAPGRPEALDRANEIIRATLQQEHAEHFEQTSDELWCKLSQQRIGLKQPARELFAALSEQVQEDLVIFERRPDRTSFLSLAHICAPGFWSPEEKVGRNFTEIHEPVPHAETMNKYSDALVDGAIRKGPLTRFTWGFVVDDRLNHHPEPPPGVAKSEWDGPRFSPSKPFWIRIERQVLLGMPEVDAFLFSIRTHFLTAEEVLAKPEQVRALRAAVASMSPESLTYKSLSGTRDELLELLDNTLRSASV